MTPQPRLETCRRKRRASPILGIGISIIAIALLLVGGWFVWRVMSPGALGSTRTPTAVAPSAATTSAPDSARATHPPTETVPVQTTTPAAPVDAQAGDAAAASDAATAKAAVSFPGAPAISPTTRSVNTLHPRHKYIALTLDDGYGFQPQMLELLKQYDVRCTTFLVGSWAAQHTADLKLMKGAGFEIANHSWTHPDLTKMSSDQVASQLERTQRVITSVTGNQAPYLRPPFGATDSSVKATAAGLGYRIVMWDRTFGDSGRGATPKKLYDNVVNAHGGVQPGDVILCHWGSKPSYAALKLILPELRARGYELVTVSELIADSK